MTKFVNKYTRKWSDLMVDYRRYESLDDNDLFDFYNSISENKYRTYVQWVEWVNENYPQATYVKVLSRTCHQYTLGFLSPDENTGVLSFFKITRDNIYQAEL